MELDRDNLQRLLYRFDKLGLWTKLRPGIWNFLERVTHVYVYIP